ncbi:bifunctional nuclease family protein [candidate division TA06 bacterium]|uniref:Bifunctional nuclease family protein n=1 Tax=candidate division TA06 bacterium TaxID=2250710 RepID=A0A523XSD8_UNCT6|nr:MAG: bifunctional nuclease family protein [candidate division TA06 bacterium]
MKVSGLGLDKNSDSPVVLLKEADGERVLPIWIGHAEASAIAIALEGIKVERPLTHDLIRAVIEGLKAKVSRILINELKDNTFYAKIYLERGKSIINVDARPSDSIALALRVQVPIFVSQNVLSSSGTSMEIDDETRAKTLKKFLANLNPEDFGKYKIT